MLISCFFFFYLGGGIKISSHPIDEYFPKQNRLELESVKPKDPEDERAPLVPNGSRNFCWCFWLLVPPRNDEKDTSESVESARPPLWCSLTQLDLFVDPRDMCDT